MVYKIRHNEHFTFITIVFFSFSSSTIFSPFFLCSNNIENICSVYSWSHRAFYSRNFLLYTAEYTILNAPIHIVLYMLYRYKFVHTPAISHSLIYHLYLQNPTSQSWKTKLLAPIFSYFRCGTYIRIFLVACL